jgi:hypothetical protein
MATRGFMPYRDNSMNNFMKILQMYKMMQALGPNEAPQSQPGPGGLSISDLGSTQAGVGRPSGLGSIQTGSSATGLPEEEERRLRELALLGGFQWQ